MSSFKYFLYLLPFIFSGCFVGEQQSLGLNRGVASDESGETSFNDGPSDNDTAESHKTDKSESSTSNARVLDAEYISIYQTVPRDEFGDCETPLEWLAWDGNNGCQDEKYFEHTYCKTALAYYNRYCSGEKRSDGVVSISPSRPTSVDEKLAERILPLPDPIPSNLLDCSKQSCRTYDNVNAIPNGVEVEGSGGVRAGDTIILKNKRYTDNLYLKGLKGSASNPIVIRAETPGQAMIDLSGKANASCFTLLDSEYVYIYGFVLKNCDSHHLVLENTKHSRISNNYFLGDECDWSNNLRSALRLEENADHIVIDRNTFNGPDKVYLQVEVVPHKKEGFPDHIMIALNLFKNQRNLGDDTGKGNGGETIQIGENGRDLGAAKTFVTVRNNYFYRTNGEGELISNKSSSNVYAFNHFHDSRGTLTIRNGQDAIVAYNLIDGTTDKNTRAALRSSADAI